MSKILVSGGLVPTTKDTLLDARTRVATFSDIANIENPARFMVITVEDTGKKYEVKKLSSKIIGGIVVENSTIDINDPEALVDLGLAEELRSEEEKVRQSNEKKRIEAENLRKSAEDSRNVNETNRVSAEGVREASERTRVSSEETRNANEQTRNSNETKRQLQESTRQSQESARQNNERTRNTNESARKEAESGRKTEETSRRTAELSRSSAENERVKNEQNRTTAENTRSSAEDRRVVNETQRTTNETARSNAELSREQAEGNRSSTFNTLKGQMQTTIKEGQTAVAATEKATSDAQKVVDNYDAKVAEQDSKLTELGSEAGALDKKIEEVDLKAERIKDRYEDVASDKEERIIIEGNGGEHLLEIDENGVTAKAVYAIVNGEKKDLDKEKQDKLIYDEVPTLDSHNAVDSNAVAKALLNNSMNETTEDDSEFVLLEDRNGNEVVKVGKEGLSIGKSIRKYLQGKYRRGEYISSGGDFKTASSLSMFEYDVTGISSVVVESVISSSTGIPLWNGYKDGVRVGKGTVYSSGNELRKEIVDTTGYDVLYVNAQILGGACVYVEEYGLTEVGSYKSNNVGLFLGDSLMQGVGAPLGFDAVSYAEKILGCKTFNGGIGGTTMKDDGRGANLYKVVESLLSGDWSDVDSFISNILDSVNSDVWHDVPLRYSEIKKLKMQDISFVFICYGANDWKAGATLDNEDNKEDVTTVCGSLRYAVRRLTEISPSIQIFVATPGYRSAEEETPEINGVTLRAFCHAVEEACKDLHIPCWNQYLNNGLNKHNASLYLNDGTHRNAQGYALLGSQYANFINNNLNRIIL